MSAWVVVPCLLALRDEFNAVSPKRDKGADGTIGDTAHSSGGTSDHLPDEDFAALRDHDADSKNEVHALDIDSSGPWPGGWAWFNDTIVGIVDRHRRGEDDRLSYVIWNHRIASASRGWTWRTYVGSSDPHTNHAHFSARYTTAQENDTSEWGVDDMPTADEVAQATANKLFADLSNKDSGLYKAFAERAQAGTQAFFALGNSAASATGETTQPARYARDIVRAVTGGPIDVATLVKSVSAAAVEAVNNDRANGGETTALNEERVASLVAEKIGEIRFVQAPAESA